MIRIGHPPGHVRVIPAPRPAAYIHLQMCAPLIRKPVEATAGELQGVTMTSAAVALVPNELTIASIQAHIDREIDDLIASLPDPGQLSAAERRTVIARY